MIELGDALLRPARSALGEGGLPLRGQRVDLSPSHFGDDAVAMGAAALARHRLCADPDGAATPATRRSDAARIPGLFLMV
jgi:hypothetical protein